MLRFFTRLFRGKDEKVVHPEHAFRVWDTDEALHCQLRDEPEESMRWDDLHEIRIITTDEGPMLPDAFWRFSSRDREIVFPQMALGEKSVIDRAMKLPGYDYDQSIAAMRSTDNAEFIVWRRV
jgi:hypothetical protein